MKLEREALNHLFIEARAGSRRALDLLISGLRPLVYRRASRFVENWHPGVGPSTLTQEVSRGIAKIITRVRGSSNGTLWALVNKLVHSKGISAYRHVHSQKRDGGVQVSLDDVMSNVVDERQGPDEQLEQKERAHRLLVEIAHLPERQRIALEDALAGESPAATAARLECTEIAVVNLVQRAKHKLQKTDEMQPPEPLTAALLSYLRRISEGRTEDPAGFALDHPEHETELREFLLWFETVRRHWSRPGHA